MSVADRLWSKVDRRGGEAACWPFSGRASVKAGHRQISCGGQMRLAHRVAFDLTFGEIPPGMVVRHSCDHPPCCNPRHLLLGTQADNVRDRDGRGRQRTLEGSAHPNSKLTAEAVVEIRRRRTAGEKLDVLAAAFGVSLTTISRIASHRAWSHVT